MPGQAFNQRPGLLASTLTLNQSADCDVCELAGHVVEVGIIEPLDQIPSRITLTPARGEADDRQPDAFPGQLGGQLPGLAATGRRGEDAERDLVAMPSQPGEQTSDLFMFVQVSAESNDGLRLIIAEILDSPGAGWPLHRGW